MNEEEKLKEIGEKAQKYFIKYLSRPITSDDFDIILKFALNIPEELKPFCDFKHIVYAEEIPYEKYLYNTIIPLNIVPNELKRYKNELKELCDKYSLNLIIGKVFDLPAEVFISVNPPLSRFPKDVLKISKEIFEIFEDC
jgi:hypothetical protein